MPSNAEKYNVMQSMALGWSQAFEMLHNSGIRCVLAHGWTERTDPEFVELVQEWQDRNGLDPDGFFGPNSWERYKTMRHGLLERSQTILAGGLHVPIYLDGVQVRHDPAMALTKHRADSREKARVIVHWGGWNVGSCHRFLEQGGKSSHFLVGDGEVYQCVDLSRRGIHAKGWNGGSVGVDICRTPRIDLMHRTEGQHIQRNTTGRGPEECLSIPEGVAETARTLLGALAPMLGLVFEYHGHDVMDDRDIKAGGVLGHHNTDAMKWDVAPWAGSIWP